VTNRSPLQASLSLNKSNADLMEYWAELIDLLVRKDMDPDDFNQVKEVVAKMKKSAATSRRVYSMFDFLE